VHSTRQVGVSIFTPTAAIAIPLSKKLNAQAINSPRCSSNVPVSILTSAVSSSPSVAVFTTESSFPDSGDGRRGRRSDAISWVDNESRSPLMVGFDGTKIHAESDH
jgi:hypothetical protein